MAMYICDRPFKDATLGDQWHFWADTVDEAHAALWAVGVNPAAALETWQSKRFPAYAITAEQFVALAGLGVKITDRFGPLNWSKAREAGKVYCATATSPCI
jgi:hypothetical protein